MPIEYDNFTNSNPQGSDNQNRLNRLSPESKALRLQAQTHILSLWPLPLDKKAFLFRVIDNLFLNIGDFRTDYETLTTLIDNQVDKFYSTLNKSSSNS